MAAKFRKVDPRIWHDEKFRRLTQEQKFIALYCLTSGQCNRIGIFHFNVVLACDETFQVGNGNVAETFRERLLRVINSLSWEWDDDQCVLYFPTWWKYQLPNNPNVLQSCLEDVHDVPQTHLIERFMKNVKYLKGDFRERFLNVIKTFDCSIGNVAETFGERSTPGAGAGTGGPPSPETGDNKHAELAQLWVFHSKAFKNGRKRDKEYDIAPEFEALMRLGYKFKDLEALIIDKDEQRDLGEYLWMFKSRLLKTPPARKSTQKQEDFERNLMEAREKARLEAEAISAEPKIDIAARRKALEARQQESAK